MLSQPTTQACIKNGFIHFDLHTAPPMCRSRSAAACLQAHVHLETSPATNALHGNLHPPLKGETLKKWLRDNFENRSGDSFQKSLKNGILFQTILKKGSSFELSLKKYPRPGPGRTGPRPGTQALMGYLFKLSLKMDTSFKIV